MSIRPGASVSHEMDSPVAAIGDGPEEEEAMTNRERDIERLVSSYQRGRLSRREFLGRATALGLGVPTVAALLAACGGSSGGGGDTAAADASTGAEAATAADTAAAADTATPVSGGTLVEGYDRQFSPITTINAAWVDPTQDAMLESLVTNDPQGNLVTKLAESWEVSDDAQTWTFTVREGVTFHSGAPMTTDNVAQDLNLDRGDAGQHPYWYTQVTGIEPGDGNTVVVTCDKPFASLGSLYRQQFTNIFNYAAVEADPEGYGTNVVDGTGPFSLVNFTPSEVEGKRFDGYAGSIVPYFTNKGKAYLDGIRWVAVPEASNRANEVISGNVDVTKNPLPSDLESLESNSDLVVIEKEEAAGLVLGLNFTKTNLGFDDVRVRQAVSHAIDRTSIVDAILFGHGSPVQGPFPTSYKWYEPGVEQFNQFDPEKAKALLDEAGWTAGSDGTRARDGQAFEFTIVNQTDAVRNQVGDAIVAMLADVGIRASMKNLETGTYFQELGAGPDAYFFNWLWLDFPRIYQVLADSRFIPAPNWANASVPEVDAAMDEFVFAADDAAMEAAARSIQLAVAEHVPVLTVYVPNVIWVHNKRLHGYLPMNPNSLYPYYNDMWLEA